MIIVLTLVGKARSETVEMLAGRDDAGETQNVAHRCGTHVPPRTKRLLAVVAAVLALATIGGIVLLRPTGERRPSLQGLGFVSEVYDAEVVAVEEQPCEGQPEAGVTCRRVAFERRQTWRRATRSCWPGIRRRRRSSGTGSSTVTAARSCSGWPRPSP